MSFCWTTLHVRNLDTSLAFYMDIAGLSLKSRRLAGPGTELAFLGDGETKLELIASGSDPNPTVGSGISIGFTVESVDAAIGMMKEKGIPVESGPFQPGPGIRFFFVLDPDGWRVQFVEMM